jgi:haloalkane dehalogenase
MAGNSVAAKLFIEAEPGVFIPGRIRRLASSFPDQHCVVDKGLHFLQEDSLNEIGREIAG